MCSSITFMSQRELSPNVYGIETEYSGLITFPGNIEYEIVGACHSADVAIGLYREPKKRSTDAIPTVAINEALRQNDIYSNSQGMLSNGGRLYIDPSGFEYATPETSTAEEAVHRSFDGDEILLGALSWLRDSEYITDYQINRKIVDHNRTSRGIHLNTTTNIGNEPTKKIERCMTTLEVVKGAIFGSGGLLLDDFGSTHYHHAPRLSLTNQISNSAFKSRSLIRAPFKPDGAFHRIESVSGDALNFAWPLRASLVVTNALMGIVEIGYGKKLPKLRQPTVAAQTVGRYGYKHLIGTIDTEGKDIEESPLDVLSQICEEILLVNEKEGQLDAESKQVMNEIIYVIDRMSDDPYSAASQVESIARLVAMEKKMEKDNLSLNSERLCRFDYAWDWIGGAGIAEGLRNRNKAGWQGFTVSHSPANIKKRLITPPQDTRAKPRGDVIKLHKGSNSSDWMHIDFGTMKSYVHPLEFRATSSTLEK